MKKFRLIAIISLCFVVAFSAFAGCKNKSNKEDSSSENNSGNVNDEVTFMDDYIVKNGTTPYKIVVPQAATDAELFAAEELQYFFELSTKKNLPIVTDEGIADKDGRYLSVGKTTIAEAAGLSLRYDELGDDGYKVKTYGTAVAMSGAHDDGTIFSVYGFLNKQFNLEIFTEDVFTYDTVKEKKLVALDWTDIPDIPNRTGGSYVSQQSVTGTYRYRQNRWQSGWGLWGHSHFDILPTEVYLAAHPDWYNKSESPTQLAWANEEMWAQFIECLKEIILSKPTATHFMLGQEDSADAGWDMNTDGTTGKFADVKAANGGTNSAVQIIFLNHVVREINKWAAEVIPDRTLEFSMFAYWCTIDAPTKTNEAGEIVAYNENVILEPNLGVMYAPIGSRFDYAYTDKDKNGSAAAVFEGWDVLSSVMHVWSYSANFYSFISPINHWGSIKENMIAYEKMNVTYLAEQGSVGAHSPVCNYMELHQYLYSQLAWDNSQDVEELIVKFMKAYYAEGWEEVYEWFTLLRNRMIQLEEEVKKITGQYRETFLTVNNFPKFFVDKGEMLFKKAIADAEAAGNERAKLAIQKDQLTVRYILLQLYASYYSSDDYLAMVDEFEKVSEDIGMKYVSEAGYNNDDNYRVSTLIAKWKKNVL